MENKLLSPKNIYRFQLAIFFIVLALPLLSNPPYFFPQDWGKAIVFRIIISILFFTFLWQILFQKSADYSKFLKEKIYKNIIFWILTALIGVFFLATIFSQDINFSLWGSPLRGQGFVTFAFYIIFCVLSFLIIKPADWKKLWIWAFIIGIIVSTIGIFQRFAMFSNILVWEQSRAGSSVGGPIFLAMYLLFLAIPAFYFGIKEKNWKVKIFYFALFVFFSAVIVFITQTRAVMLGLAIGFLYFLIFYPIKNKRLSFWIKIATLLTLAFSILGIYYINIHPDIPQFNFKNPYLNRINSDILPKLISRLSIPSILNNSRFSSWKVSWPALMEKPVLGYGPENFAIGFDKFYNPTLSGINIIDAELNSWWDRAHNFIFDIANTAGIPALLVFLSLFAVLFWKLEKAKKSVPSEGEGEKPENEMILHGLQTTFIVYLVANFFSFDTFCSYLFLFFTISYAIFLIKNSSLEESPVKQKKNFEKTASWKKIIIITTAIILTIFIWFYNIKPLIINAPINIAEYFTGVKQCNEAFNQMEKILPSHSFLDSYVRMEYVGFIKKCASYTTENDLIYAKKGVELLKEAVKIQPAYTRYWIFLGSFTNVLIDKEQNSEQKQKLVEEANYYFEKTSQLSPNRQEIYIEWAKTDMIVKNYQGIKEKSEKCIELNPNFGDCYWMLWLSDLYLKDYKNAEKDLNMALEKGFEINSMFALNQLANVYAQLKDYQNLSLTYEKLIRQFPNAAEYHASLAFTYAQMGRYEDARKQALLFLEMMPEAESEVDAFLKTLPY